MWLLTSFLDEEGSFLKRIVAFVTVLIVLFGVNGYILYRLYLTSELLVEARKDTFVEEFKGKAAVLDDYLSQTMTNLQALLKSPTIVNYYHNKALGMSPQYGLAVSLKEMSDDFNRVQQITTGQGRQTFSGIAYFDLSENRNIAKSDSVVEISNLQDKVKAWGDSDTIGIISTNGQEPKEERRLFLVGPFRYRGDVRGYVLMELDKTPLEKILELSADTSLNDFSALIGWQGKVFVGPAEIQEIDVKNFVEISDSLPEYRVFDTFKAHGGPGAELMGALKRLTENNLYLVTVAPRSRYFAGHSSALWGVVVLSLMASVALMGALIYKGALVIFRMNQSLERNVADLSESEERTRLLLESSVEGFIGVSMQEEITFVNRAACGMLGYSTGELVGQRLDTVIHRQKEGSKYLPENYSVYDSILRGITCKVDNAVLWRKDGTTFPVDLYSNSIHKEGRIVGCVITFDDITDRKRAEEALRDSEEKFQTVADFTYNWEYWIAPDNSLVYVSPSCERITGYSAYEFISNPGLIQQIILTGDPSATADDMALTDTGAPHETEFSIVCRSGETRWIGHASQAVYSADGACLGRRVSNRDITRRKRLEAERMEMERKLLHAQKIESLNAMARGIAHDFNNLLMVIMGNLELALTDRGLSPLGKDAIQNAIQATDRSAELSHQMLIYSGKLFYVPMDLDLGEMATGVAHKNEDLFRLVIPKTTTLHFEISEGLPLIRGDESQIRRVITNLVINAYESIGENTGDVTLKTGVMDCDGAYLSQSRLHERPSPGRFVFLEIRDTGCGMDAETQRRLFDPFFTTKFWGRGLGMAEVMGVVNGHHGAIIVESEVGKGTSIRVLFPVPKRVHDRPVRVTGAVEAEAPSPESASRRKTVLVVEDEELVRNMVLSRLDVLGYDTISAANGEDGLRIFRERLKEIDLVLLDFAMPQMNGVEAFGELIKIKPDVKVILSSGYTEDVVSKSFPGKQPEGFLNKPYKLEVLKDELDRLLERPLAQLDE